jgi:starvation-inducible DNA-binding protein
MHDSDTKAGGQLVAGELRTPTDLTVDAVEEISAALRHLLADVFALHMKTKNFHWHVSGRHFRDDHSLLDEHSEQLFAMTDEIAERARKIGGTTLRSIGDISRHQNLEDNNDAFVAPRTMIDTLLGDNRHLVRSMRSVHELRDRHRDVASASLIETWIDRTERRTWSLFEIAQDH